MIAGVIGKANDIANAGRPVIVGVRIDYSKKTAFTLGAVKTNFGRFPLNEKLRFLTRAAVRHVVGRADPEKWVPVFRKDHAQKD